MQPRRIDPLSFTAGLVFCGLGLAFLLDTAELIRLDLASIWPLLLIGLGVGAMLAGTARRRD